MSRLAFNLLITAVLTTNSAIVRAHSFDLGLVIPITGSQSESGQQAFDGFLLATTEEDSHPDETSDGHLGGLDSQVRKIDSGVSSTEMLNSLEELIQERQPIFITGLFSAETADLIAKSSERGHTVFFDPSESSLWQTALNAPDKLKLMNGDSFAIRFQNRYGYSPTLEVMRGYIAARLIAATVRSLSEDQLDDPRVLASTLAGLQSELQ